MGHAQEQRRIDAARKTDQRRPVPADHLAQAGVFFGERAGEARAGEVVKLRAAWADAEAYQAIETRSLAATAAATSAARSSLASALAASSTRARVAGCGETNSEQQSSKGRIEVS